MGETSLTLRTLLVASLVVAFAVLLSGCAGAMQLGCEPGMTLRNEGEGYFCQGFGRGFVWRRADPLRWSMWGA